MPTKDQLKEARRFASNAAQMCEGQNDTTGAKRHFEAARLRLSGAEIRRGPARKASVGDAVDSLLGAYSAARATEIAADETTDLFLTNVKSHAKRAILELIQ